ncbi:methyl-accepting chemotaxis protein [Vibrio alfacsensis]|uniref:methyl-accepting chemotaxis protein n=1 Tax=Vibrio alfacsensis TaxID=1074311 RepID=UPI0040688D24
MRGSVVKRMYAGFVLIIILFAITIAIMMGGMNDIHGKFENVSKSSLPLVSLSNQTSVELLSADKSFKDFLTTDNKQRMDEMRQEFAKSQEKFAVTLSQLEVASQIYPSLAEPFSQLKQLEQSYFAEAMEAMGNYEVMLVAQEQVQKSSRRFQKLNSEVTIGIKERQSNRNSVAFKVFSDNFFGRLQDAEIITSDALASNDPDFVNNAVQKNRKTITHLMYAFKALVNEEPEVQQALGEAMEVLARDISQPGGVLDQQNNYLAARKALYGNIANLAAKVDATMSILEQFNTTAADTLNESLAEAGKIYSQGVTKVIVIGVIVVLFATAIGYHIAHSVRDPLTRILKVLEGLAQGDMTRRIDIRYNNEFSQVSGHINTLADNLHNILVKLNDASENLASTAATNERTSSQAQSKLSSQREQTSSVAAAMTEMSNSVQEVAQSAQGSLEMVQRVESASDQGRNVMSSNISTINQLEARLNESVSAVSELQKMSGQIGSILDVIRNIAEQTNLLALNAAIEAARAGEQGRGFAVVADEVRVLASKTTQSTTEIESMISNLQSRSLSANQVIQSCVSEMEMSVEQASKANSSMEEIQSLIMEISQMSTHITHAAAEQSATSADIARNIEDINSISDESYQAMSSIAQTSESLTQLAHQQNELVHQFKL